MEWKSESVNKMRGVPRDGVTSEKVSATNQCWPHKDLENKCGSVLYD